MADSTVAPTRPSAALAVNGGEPVSATPVPVVSVALDESDIEAAVRVLRSGMLAQGANVAELEQRFADMTGARHAVACANGTCALQLAYEPLIEPGDEVLVPAWGYISTATMIIARGARPILVDADPDTFLLDLEDAKKRITEQTTAIAATHLYGLPCDAEAIEAFAIDHGLSVVFDAAQAHLATVNARGLGAFGDAVTYSFYPTKNMTTGEGGMVTTNDDDLADTLRRLRSHGETQKYLHEVVGYNYRMTDVEAAIGCSQLSRLPQATATRRKNAARLDRIVDNIDGLTPPVVPAGRKHVYHQYAVRMDLDRFTCTRDEFIAALRAEGVMCAVHYPRALTQQPVFEPLLDGARPVSERLANSLFCLPVHPNLQDADFDVIDAALRKVADAFRA
jgi:perosamine synthetase